MINVHVSGDFSCDRNGIDVTLSVLTGANPMAIASEAPPELSTSSADARATGDRGVVAMHQAPAVSLGAFDAAVCIASDTP